MRKISALLLVVTALIAVGATGASATSISPSPGGNITATIRRLGFSGFLISLFTCDVSLEGSISTGPITLPGRAGSISGVSITNCSAMHRITAQSLPWSITAQSVLRTCPSSSTGVLGVLAASFNVDGITIAGNIGTLVASGRGTISILASSLSNSGRILAGSGTYSPTQTISCT
jgi:hypothetical protein